tara:strand:- start:540 stop:971 length:432 start_codon:yes stop_codon:yes gene_type:complete
MIALTINRKIFRYLLVSVVSVVIGQLLLYLFFKILGLDASLSNFLSVTLSTIPNYLLNRYWVWRKSGPHDLKREIFPYWIIAFTGLGLSTLFVFLADRIWDSWVVVNCANLSAYGSLWVLKFVILDRYLFNTNSRKDNLSTKS